ncbi:MAG TPA: N-acetylmuramic acid 6-phosphate etherase [Verrucomicrobiales bacterium]|nr:N-acetylmuramic acid 6-phosphate etherase [Verrucomicrobiales bacterium]
MILLGMEGGGTRTSALLVDSETNTVLAKIFAGTGNLYLLTGERLADLLEEIRAQLPVGPDRIGIGFAGVRSGGDRERLTAAVSRTWPGVPAIVTDDLVLALESTEWHPDCAAQVLLLSGTGSCCLGRHRDGRIVKVGGRGHVIGDRGSSYDIALHALRSVVTISDIDADWPPLGADILHSLQMNDPERLIDWTSTASKIELASLAQVVFAAAASRQDPIAVAILDRAAERLSKDSVHCAARIAKPEEKIQFILNGSVLLKNPCFADEVVARILKARPGSEVVRLDEPSVWGAIAMALDPGVGASRLATVNTVSIQGDLETTAKSWRPVSTSPTEGRHPKSIRFSDLPISQAIQLMLEEDKTIPEKILAESEQIEWVVKEVVRAFSEGGRLLYCGAGTSGRLGVLDASECPPTFRTSPDLVQGIIAGGSTALWSAVEGAEDDFPAGERAIQSRHVGPKDVVIAISASGHAPFIWGCLTEAKERGAKTALVCCNPAYRGHPLLDGAILPDTGPEILTGSTRLKSGTATKMILNIITTLAMTHSGKVKSNLMIDLHPSNAKLRDRAVRIVREITGAEEAVVERTLESNGWMVRAACEELTPTIE